MSIEFRCPKCETLLRVDDEVAGQRAACPRCDTEMEIPYVSCRRASRSYAEIEESEQPPERERAPEPPATPADQAALLSLVLGIFSVLFSLCCLVGLPMGGIAIERGIRGLESRNRSMAISGIVLGGLGILMGLVVVVTLFLMDIGVIQTH